MKLSILMPAMAAAACAFSLAAAAMTTVPYSGKAPSGPNGFNSPDAQDNRIDPYAPGTQLAPPRTGNRNARSPWAPERQRGGFLNIDPFDPNSTVNNFDRDRYANPYPYDPIYNPYGQGASRFSPSGPNVPMGQGIPYAR